MCAVMHSFKLWLLNYLFNYFIRTKTDS